MELHLCVAEVLELLIL